MLVGEQPGDREDIEGQPFVGPAGRVLDEGLERAGIERADVFVTNVVKHFRYKLRGKRRIHQRPERVHVAACRPWLDAELHPGLPAGARVPRRHRGAGPARARRSGSAVTAGGRWNRTSPTGHADHASVGDSP